MMNKEFRYDLQLKDAVEAALLYGALKKFPSENHVEQGELLERIQALSKYAIAHELACEYRAKFEELAGHDPDIL